MNRCFLMGIIQEEVKFKFVLNGKHDSIANIKLKLLNNTIVKVTAYDKDADYCYRRLSQYDLIIVDGRLNTDYSIIVEKIYK